MSDDIIHVGNTPIFDELVRRMGERKFNTLLSPKGLGALQPVPIPGTTFDLPKPAQDGVEQVLERNVCPDVLSKRLVSLNHFINEMVKEFQEKHPEVHPIHITRLDEIDGTITIRVTKAELEEQTDEDVNAAPRPLYAMHLPGAPKEQHEYFHVRGEAAVLPPIVKISSSIGEDLPDALYMKTSTWGSDEE